MPRLEHKPGRFWDVTGRGHLPCAQPEEVQLTEKQAFLRRYRRAITPPEKRRRLKFGMNDPREFSVSLFADASFWRARLWALVGDEPDAYELPEHTSALAGLLHSMAENRTRFGARTSAGGMSGRRVSAPDLSWLAASTPTVD